MTKFKIQNKSSATGGSAFGGKIKISNTKTKVLSFGICALLLFCALCFVLCHFLYAQEQFVYDAKGKRNPFIPLVTPDGRLLKLEKEQTLSGLSLEGIIYDEHGLSYAIVNSEVVRVSDKIGDYQVLKIEKNKVIFIKGGQITEVELKEEGP